MAEVVKILTVQQTLLVVLVVVVVVVEVVVVVVVEQVLLLLYVNLKVIMVEVILKVQPELQEVVGDPVQCELSAKLVMEELESPPHVELHL